MTVSIEGTVVSTPRREAGLGHCDVIRSVLDKLLGGVQVGAATLAHGALTVGPRALHSAGGLGAVGCVDDSTCASVPTRQCSVVEDVLEPTTALGSFEFDIPL